MEQHRLFQVFFVESSGKAGQHHHGEFQSLGLVDAQQAHRVGLASGFHGDALRLRPLQPCQKLVQALSSALFKAGRKLAEPAQVFQPPGAVGHGAVNVLQPRNLVNFFQQAVQGQLLRCVPQVGNRLQERADSGLRVLCLL